MPAISVIMPVYNSEKYLSAAIESILNQTFTDFEFICIDDGSTDRSGAICDEYASKDSRLVVIHQNNGGICAARNRGLEEATGDYIAFMDNDDECEKNLLEANYQVAVQHNADMVKFGRSTITVQNGQHSIPRYVEFENRIYQGSEIIENYFLVKLQYAFSNVWDGLYKRALIQEHHIEFHERLKYGEEDVIFCFDYLKVAHTLALHSGKYLTHYLRYGHSTSAKFHLETLERHIYGMEIEYGLLQYWGINNQNSTGQVVSAITMRLVPVLRLFEHPDCHLTKPERICFLQRMAKHPYFQYRLSLTSLGALCGMSPKYLLIAMLFQMGQYRSCILLSKLQKTFK